MQKANITTIYKSKGSRLSLENDRGIFVINILKMIIDRMVYEDKYEEIDKGMSDYNIGGRRNQNIKNHLFIIYGIINSVINGGENPVDIQIYDIEKAFDALWLEDTMNDLVDTLPQGSQDDKIALIFEANKHNQVAINTVGETERVEIERIVMQGGTWGPIQCSNSIDKIGKKCLERGQHLYLYKDRVTVLPLGMVDDLIGVSRCGHPSVELNTYITTQIELKKLRFHVPDQNGKTKCHQIHIGKQSELCPELKIHGHKIEKVHLDTYLGDIISSDGCNKSNIMDRVGKAIGIMNKIINILDTVSFGAYYFKIFNLLRESMFVNGTLTNADVWYGLEKNDLKELEDLDRQLIRRVFNCPISTPQEAGHLELGLLPLSCIVKERRVNYLQYLLKTDKSKMLYRFFMAQWESPVKNDWTQQIRSDLSDLGIKEDFTFIQSKSVFSFKNLVKVKIKEYALDMLNEKKFKHSKMDDLIFTELKIQEYLVSESITLEEKRSIFQYRTRMAKFSENYRGKDPPRPCQICLLHVDSQSHAVRCFETMRFVTTVGNYQEIFGNKISDDTANMLKQIDDVRNNKLG